MKANEFIKKYGIEYAIKFLNYDASIAEDRCVLDFGEYYYLKRLVESHELIESWGGLDSARKEAHKNCFDFSAPLLKAILDVESCQ